jgi:beta-glucosidase
MAHASATRAMKLVDPNLVIGITVNMSNFRVDSVNPETLAAVDLVDAQMNRWWIDALVYGKYPESIAKAYGSIFDEIVLPGDESALIAEPDFLGINYYSDSFVADAREQDSMLSEGGLFPFDYRVNMEMPESYKPTVTDMGWPITPDGLGNLVTRVHREWPMIPYIVITENGSAYDDAPNGQGIVADDRRIDYLRKHLVSLGNAISAGVPVKGYFAWSLLDNFEWSFGYEKRFGLVHVDFNTQKRTLKNSALEYKNIIATGEVNA